MKNGGHLQVEARLEDMDFVSITLSDSGPGIAEKDLKYVFEPFFYSRDGESGTGLGLAIAARAINRHGGAIEARNVNDGLLVTMTLG